ncbi:MAG: hypothetical protein E7327_11685 [Clostridiales bacterium]|nr:hypothetical protein [Clostridiales bacterium]
MRRLLCLLAALLLPITGLSEEGGSVLSLRITRQGETHEYHIPREVIPQQTPTPEEIAHTPDYAAAPAAERYRCDTDFAPHETLSFKTHEVSRFSRYDGDTPLWTAEIRDYQVQGWQETTPGVLLWGHTDVSLRSYGYPITAWMTLLSHDGEVIWSQALSPMLDWEQPACVIENGNGIYVAFSTYYNGGQEGLCVRQICADGQMLSATQTSASALGLSEGYPRFTLRSALALEDGFLLHLTSGTRDLLAQLSPSGKLQQVIVPDCADGLLTLTDMQYHSGSLWLSGYLTPGQPDEDHFQSSRSEVTDVISAAYRRMEGWGRIDIDWLDLHLVLGSKPVTSEYLVPRIRERYTAVLLRIDPANVLPLAAYTVDGCLGGALTAGDSLTWDVESLTACRYSPFTSSYTLFGTAKVFRYSFSGDGTLEGGGETDETAEYWR